MLLEKYDPHLIARACNYLYTKETMSSYQIEREQPDKNRLMRFIHLLQKASSFDSLSKQQLIELQNVIVDPRFKNSDYRQSQNYVGENISPYFQKIHYISPKAEDVPSLMQGLLDSLERMTNASMHPVILAAAISFGFVFIHPFEDGNGRIHRFLIHSILSKNAFTPTDMVFPISYIMLQNRHAYDALLEIFSKPLLYVLTKYDLKEDGSMSVHQETKSYYQYIDYTWMAEYLFRCIEEIVNHYIEREIKFLLHYDLAKKSIQNIVDMPDNQIDLFIKLVMQNKGLLSANKRNRFFPLLKEEEVEQLTAVINDLMMDKK
jgi:Fic family protein